MRYFTTFLMLFFLLPAVFGYDDGTKVASAELYQGSNSLLDTADSRIAMIIPAVMVIITIVCLMIDFGVIGVAVGGILSLVMLYMLQILPITVPGLVSIVILGVILMFKLRA